MHLPLFPIGQLVFGIERILIGESVVPIVPVLTRWIQMLVALIVLAAVLVIGILYWYVYRPLPTPITDLKLFDGIYHTRVVHPDGRALIYQVVSIDLTTSTLRFFATPADVIDGFDYAARTTSDFLTEFGLQLAINGDFFDPWRDYGPLDYYPQAGDGVNGRGLSVSLGQVVTEGYAPRDRFETLYISADNRVAFTEPDFEIETAISGNVMILRDGIYQATTATSNYLEQRHPRTAIALDETGETLLLIVVDGRQSRYSAGATMEELAEIIRAHGGYTALNLDGGGSTALVMADADGQPQTLNSPIHNRVPGRQRPIANHLGLWIGPSQTP